MDDQLSTSFIFKYKKSKSYCFDKMSFSQSQRRQSARIKTQSEVQNQEQSSIFSNTIQDLQWQKGDAIDEKSSLCRPNPKTVNKRKLIPLDWFGRSQKTQIERTLNDMFFNLDPKAQRLVYLTNYVLNIAIRIMFINLLVFLGISNNWIYFEVFLSLEATAVVIYLIVMVKMLFTRSDRESIYFQKIFNQAEWADIQSQRLMRNHFNLNEIVCKISVFFNPFTKFDKNTKISFLRQQLFKRMELVIVYIPFAVVFFLRPDDFVADGRPNFNVYITAGICLESIRTASTYLIVYIYD